MCCNTFKYRRANNRASATAPLTTHTLSSPQAKQRVCVQAWRQELQLTALIDRQPPATRYYVPVGNPTPLGSDHQPPNADSGRLQGQNFRAATHNFMPF